MFNIYMDPTIMDPILYKSIYKIILRHYLGKLEMLLLLSSRLENIKHTIVVQNLV